MSAALIRQAQFVPLTALVVMMVAGLFVPGYSSVSQHLSELGLVDHPAAAFMPIGAAIAGASVCAFGVGLFLHRSKAFVFTSLCAIVFGLAFLASGFFPAGTPQHNLYGLTMFYVLVPACFAAELPPAHRSRLLVQLSLLAATASLVYMWGMLSGVEPHGVRGVTQRIAVIVIFGWYPVATGLLLRDSTVAAHQSVGL